LETDDASDAAFKSSLLMSAAEVAYRYGKKTKSALKEITAPATVDSIAASSPVDVSVDGEPFRVAN